MRSSVGGFDTIGPMGGRGPVGWQLTKYGARAVHSGCAEAPDGSSILARDHKGDLVVLRTVADARKARPTEVLQWSWDASPGLLQALSGCLGKMIKRGR